MNIQMLSMEADREAERERHRVYMRRMAHKWYLRNSPRRYRIERIGLWLLITFLFAFAGVMTAVYFGYIG